MSWLTNWWSDALNKRMCRFLIHRYLGHLLKEKLELAQLSVDLFNGTGFIQCVNVDCEYVNECLEVANLPIRLADGYIGEIKVAVPWKTLLEESCVMEVKNLEITLRPIPAFSVVTAPDLMASMLESMVGSLSSSVDLARSFLIEEQQTSQDAVDAPPNSEEGVEAFAHIIDAVLSRMRLKFWDTVIRLETYPPDGAGCSSSTQGLGVALELRIEEFEFIDEQLETCQQLGTDARPITTQPHSLYTVPDLNKLLHLRGVKLYTDIFSRPEMTPGLENLIPGSESVVFTSMYLRRHQAANRTPNESLSQESGSNVFYSCASGATENGAKTNGNGKSHSPSPLAEDLNLGISTFAESIAAPSVSSENGREKSTRKLGDGFVASDPVEFGRFLGDRQTVRLRLRNNQLADNSGLNKKLDVEMFLGGLSVILSPTQLYLLLEVLNTILEQGSENSSTSQCGLLGGKPMGSRDYAQVEQQLQTELDADLLWKTTDFSAGNWSGEEQFYDTSRRPVAKKSEKESLNLGNFTSISVNDQTTEISASPDLLQPLNIKTGVPNVQSNRSPKSPGVIDKPELTHMKLKLNSLWITLTHKDPLASESKVKSGVEKLRSLAEVFFEQSNAISLSTRTELTELRPKLDMAYPGDHLRLVGCPAVLDCTLERGGGTENVIVQFSTANSEILECLSADSVILNDERNRRNTQSASCSTTVESSVTSITSENEHVTTNATNEQRVPPNAGRSMCYVELAKFGNDYANEETESVIDESEADDVNYGSGKAEDDLNYGGGFGEEPSFKMMLTNRGRKEHYAISLELGPCFTELDLSLIDRLYNLANCYPVFKRGGQPTRRPSGEESLLEMQRKRDKERGSDLSLSEDLFAPLSRERNKNFGNLGTAPLARPGSSAEQRKAVFDIDIRCPHWTVDIRIPVADLRDAAAHDRPPWWVRRVRPESLRLKLQNARLGCSGLSETSARRGEFKLNCLEATGYFLTGTPDFHGLEKFLFATGLQGISQCSMTFKWDFLNKSLCVDGFAAPEDNSLNSWGSYFRIPKSADGPFSKDRVLHENEELTLVGNRQEMQEFSQKCLGYSELSILLDLPQVRVVLPGKEFYELLYNRLVNDLAMWEPSSPAYQTRPSMSHEVHSGSEFTGASQYYSVHVAGLSDQRFGLCKSMARHTDSDEESGDESDNTTLDRSSITGPSSGKIGRKSANRLCFRLRADQGKVLMSLPNVEDENSEGELSLAAKNGEIFVVSSYQGDPNLVYFYVTLSQAWLWHQNVNETTVKYSKNVSGRGFGRCGDEHENAPGNANAPWTTSTDLCAEPTPEGLDLSSIKEDNFAVAMRLELKAKENLKEMLIAIGIRNTTVHYQPFKSTADWWITQLVEFFNVPDYPIAGYSMPRTLAELHVHAWSSCVGYKVPESKNSNVKKDIAGLRDPMLLRLWIDNADISSYIVQDATALKLHCLFESLKLYLGDKDAVNLKRDFVCLMSMGIFELVVTVIEETGLNQEEKKSYDKRRRTPMLEVRAKNDKVTVWTCADSLAALGRVAQKIAEDSLEGKGTDDEQARDLGNAGRESGGGRQEGGKAVPVEQPVSEEKQLGNLTLSDEEELRETIEHAMADAELKEKRKPVVHSENDQDFKRDLERRKLAADFKPRSQRSSTGTDEEFCMVDEIPGSGIQSISGEPRIRSLVGTEPVETRENHFPPPSRRTDPLTSLPAGYPQPLIRYLVKDITVVVNLFSGADFCDTAPVRPYSQTSIVNTGGVGANVARKAIYARQQQLKDKDCKGGPHRDHSVHVEIQLSKICFLYELFGSESPAVSRQLLMVQDIEIRDRLALSQINKVLYQYATEKKPRQTQAPMVALRILETTPGEGRLKLSLLPLRLNIDQDTLEFLQDFGTELSDRLKQNESKRTRASSSTSSSDSGPILEVPNRRAKDSNSSSPSLSMQEQIHCATKALSENVEKTPLPSLSGLSSLQSSFKAPEELSGMQICLDPAPNVLLTDSVATLGDIFGEIDRSEPIIDTEKSIIEEKSPEEGLADDVSKELEQILMGESASGAQPLGTVKFSRMTCSTRSQDTVTSAQEETKEGKESGSQNSSGSDLQLLMTGPQAAAGGLYFKEFSFSPAVTLRLDYHGKQRFDMAQGTLQGLLIGLSQLHCTELCLKDLHHRQGLLGVERVAQFAVNEWIQDIRKHQIPHVVGSYGPISSLMQMGQGIRDLIWMPVEEYKKDGHLVKGIQKGAGSFGVSTSSAVIELAQRLVGAVQGVAEFAFDIVSPEYPPARPMNSTELVTGRQPLDFREGLGMAYDDLRTGIVDTNRVLQLAAQEERAQGRWPLRGILRQATPTVLRPLVVASKATSHVLGGLRSQLKPESRQEDLDKWRGTDK